MKTDLRPDAATIKRYSSPYLHTVFNEWSHYSAREGRWEKRKCVIASFSLPFPSFPAHSLSHLSPASWWHKEASVEEEVADDVIFGKEISKIGNDWKKKTTNVSGLWPFFSVRKNRWGERCMMISWWCHLWDPMLEWISSLKNKNDSDESVTT